MPICLMIYLSMHSISGQQDVDRFLAFMVSWFHGFVHSISRHQDGDRFCGFVVSWFISPCTPFLDSKMLKSRNLPPSRCPEMDCTKPWNQETCQHIAVQRWSARNHETTKPWNLSASCCPEMQCTKPWNHETKKPVQRWSAWRNKPWNYETMKPIIISMSRDGVHKTIKPQNHETYRHLAV